MSAGEGEQRVFLVDGQAVYLEGGGDISEDVLQQALAQLAARGQSVHDTVQQLTDDEQQATVQTMEVQGDEAEPVDLADGEEGVLAVLQDETGQQQTVRLTAEQAAALGIDYDELLAATGQVPADRAAAEEGGAPPEPDRADAEDAAADRILSLSGAPSDADDGSKVTYTFEVMDDQEPAGGDGDHHTPSDLLAKSRQIMVPQVRAATAASQPTPAPPLAGGTQEDAATPAEPVRGGAETGSDAADKPAEAAAQQAEDPDVPVILTPMNGQELPDFIEPRPGLRILVRPLETADAGGGTAAPARPLGSSDNPIQLVQQGNTFKSLQPLSAEQLKQIGTVLQRSRLNVPCNAKNTIYDANTNTRIVYRVVYPEDSRSPGQQYTARGRGRGRGRARGRGRGRGPGRPRKVDQEADQEWFPGQDTETAERAERKRLATKTRTGRVSKPPKHMVKDYRHIHRLNFNQPEMDDSDGGYSEYDDQDEPAPEDDDSDQKQEAEEANRESGAAADESEDSRETESRPKRQVPQAVRDRFTCRTCGALCIGYARLEGHYRKNPDHQRPEYVQSAPKVVQKVPGRKVGRPRIHPRPQPPAKRARMEEGPEEATRTLSADQLMAALLAQSGGDISRLCDSMASCLQGFRTRVQEALRMPDDKDETVRCTCVIDAKRAELTGLPEGVYVTFSGVADKKAAGHDAGSPDRPADAAAAEARDSPQAESRDVPEAEFREIPETESRDVPEESRDMPAAEPPEPAAEPGAAAEPSAALSDVLDEFVGGLVETTDLAFPEAPAPAAQQAASMPLLADQR